MLAFSSQGEYSPDDEPIWIGINDDVAAGKGFQAVAVTPSLSLCCNRMPGIDCRTPWSRPYRCSSLGGSTDPSALDRPERG